MRIFLMGLILILSSTVAFAETPEQAATRAEVARMRETLDGLTERQAWARAPVTSAVDSAIEKHTYGPLNKTTSRTGKIIVGGFVQIWYASIQNDRDGLFHDPAGTGIIDDNSAFDNDTFRIRRAQLNFTVNINDHVRAFINTDAAGEINGFQQLPVPLKRLAQISPEFAAANGPFPGSATGPIAAVQNGGFSKPRYLRDAIVNFHCAIPHHDFSIGQMKTSFNKEDFKNEGQLDFAERAFITNQFQRDLGAAVHGSWWGDDPTKAGVYQGAGDPGRFQYWLGVYNGAGNLHQTSGPQLARPDDNNHKDFIGTLLLRPVWNDCWGKLELGYSLGLGRHGAGGPVLAVNTLGRESTWSIRQGAWIEYYFPRTLKGLWVKGEGAFVKDRNAPSSVIDQVNNDFQNPGESPRPFSTLGYWASFGYKFEDSCWYTQGDCKPWWGKFELLFRYEKAPNVFVTDPAHIGRTNVYSSHIYTPGVNYYIKGHNAKIQVNYNVVKNPEGPSSARFHNTQNDSLIVNFQVAF